MTTAEQKAIRTVEQALYEAEVAGLMRSGGRQQIAKLVVAALSMKPSQLCGVEND